MNIDAKKEPDSPFKGWEVGKAFAALVIGGGLGFFGSTFFAPPLKFYADQFHAWLFPSKITRILVPETVYVGDVVKPQVEFESMGEHLHPGRVTFRLKSEVGTSGHPFRETYLTQTVKISTPSDVPFPDVNAPQFELSAIAPGTAQLWAAFKPEGGVEVELAAPVEVKVIEPSKRVKVSRTNQTGEWHLAGKGDSPGYLVKLIVQAEGQAFGEYTRVSNEITPEMGTVSGKKEGASIRLILTRLDTREESLFESEKFEVVDGYAKYTGTLRSRQLPCGPKTAQTELPYVLSAQCESGCVPEVAVKK